MADLNVISIFPSPLGVINFGEQSRELNRILVKNIDEEKEKHQTESAKRTFSSNECSWQSDMNLEKYYDSFRLLRDLLSQIVIPCMTDCGYDHNFCREKITVENLWANLIFDKGGWSTPHIHGSGNTLFTGVYYPKGLERIKNLDDFNRDDRDDFFKFANTLKNSDGHLVILDPSRNIKSQVRGSDNSLKPYPFYGANLFVKPRESLCVLFPAWLEHYVSPIIKKEKRYSISFAVNKKENGE